jgi:hypothetical protein
MVRLLVGVILVLVGSIVSFDLCVELYNYFLHPELYNEVGDGQYCIDTMSLDRTIGFKTFLACIRKKI